MESAFFLSADRWSVFESGAWGRSGWPDRLGDEGRRGRGLRFEAELDAWTSEVFEDALKAIAEKENSATLEEAAILETDRKSIENFRSKLWKDVNTSVQLMRDHLVALGVRALEDTPPSKSLQAITMCRRGQGYRRGHRYWVD